MANALYLSLQSTRADAFELSMNHLISNALLVDGLRLEACFAYN